MKKPFDERFSEDEREEMRMENQAILARWLKKEDERRLLGSPTQSSEEDSSDDITFRAGYIPKPWFENVPWVEIGKRQPWSVTGPLKQEKQHRVIKLTDVVILPNVGGGETIVGTLEAHVNGFIYTASGFRKHFYFDDIKYSFFRLGDKRMPPLLHFHLHPPLKKETEVTKEIEFHLLQCPFEQKRQSGQGRQKRSGRDSDKIVEEKQNRWDNKRLKKFVNKVHARWDCLRISPRLFVEVKTEYEFYGVIRSEASDAAFALTFYDLILLVETPFIVFPLEDVEIVNLALLRPGEIDMTVIFKDFKEDSVLEISSIPLTALAAVKDLLNSGDAKYYVNTKQLDWKATVKNIAAFPEKFISMGGWDQFELEDCRTLAYYNAPPKRNLVVMKEGKMVAKHE
ncbi:hypothetical protein MKW92_006223 [Papaver armeniacum]|nr:hypothetical protein MKW92_006223 [Papaver armeniacum]